MGWFPAIHLNEISGKTRLMPGVPWLVCGWSLHFWGALPHVTANNVPTFMSGFGNPNSDSYKWDLEVATCCRQWPGMGRNVQCVHMRSTFVRSTPMWPILTRTTFHEVNCWKINFHKINSFKNQLCSRNYYNLGIVDLLICNRYWCVSWPEYIQREEVATHN